MTTGSEGSIVMIKLKFALLALITVVLHRCSLLFADWAIHMMHLMHYVSAILRDGANWGTWTTSLIAGYKFCFPHVAMRDMINKILSPFKKNKK